MRLIVLWILAFALLPSSLSAAVIPDAGGAGQGPAPIPRRGDHAVAYLVVTDRQLQGAFMPLVQARTRGGLSAAVVTLETIGQAYPAGVDLAERIRMFLKDAHASWGTKWVLLGGDAGVVPMRRARLRFGGVAPPLPDLDLPTDQYYACLDGSWNADGDEFWGELPGPGEPGDDVDVLPDLYVGRAPVHDAREAVEFVQRTLAYEHRLAAGGPRSALLAADILNNIVDAAPLTERLRPVLEANPDRGIIRMYENAAAWPGSLQESRPALLDALDRGFDLAVLVGAGGRGVFVAGDDYALSDYVTSDDLLGLTNAPQCPIVYMLSAFTTAPDPPQSIGAAFMLSRRGGAVAVIGTADSQGLAFGGEFMDEFFEQALGAGTPPIGEALARATSTLNSVFVSDFTRLTTQGTVLLGDPALHLDPPAAPIAAGRPRPVYPAHVAGPGEARPTVAGASSPPGNLSLAMTALTCEAPSETSPGAPHDPARARVSSPVLARSAATLAFELPRGAIGARYQLVVFDVLGRRVRALADGAAETGRIEVSWDLRSDAGAAVPNGIYLARLGLPGASVVRRVLVLK